ncbi:MAG: TraR/DksA C4-type zinc finger protein [Chloroflexia bacterium]|nr:TraR/DksA C4-type zinc finger protein [Chloroflexia bacterium]
MTSVVDKTALREKLEQEHAELLLHIGRMEQITEELRSNRGGGDGGISNHMAEGASSTFDQERNLALLENLQRTWEQVESALKRMDDGTYGLCRACGQPIDRARLQALPYAALCLDCQSRLEER